MKLSNLETPALFVDMDIFEYNLQTMHDFAAKIGIAMRPHYKSHKTVAIAQRQLLAGAKGITCAKLSEAEDLIQAGIEDVLIANQITQPAKIARLAYLAGCCRLTVCVDTEENIRQLQAQAAMQNTTIYCLVEYEVGMQRCGVESPQQFAVLAKLIESCPNLVFEGVQAYAGNIAQEKDSDKRRETAMQVEQRLRELLTYAESQNLRVKEVSGVSTGTAGFKGKNSVYTEMQAGSYIFMDASYGELGLNFKNSLFVLTQLISANSNWLIFDAGLKSIATDHAQPFFAQYPAKEIKFSEEHCQISREGVDLSSAQRLALVPGHCCTTVNLYDWLYLIRGGRVVDRVLVNSRGKSR